MQLIDLQYFFSLFTCAANSLIVAFLFGPQSSLLGKVRRPPRQTTNKRPSCPSPRILRTIFSTTCMLSFQRPCLPNTRTASTDSRKATTMKHLPSLQHPQPLPPPTQSRKSLPPSRKSRLKPYKRTTMTTVKPTKAMAATIPRCTVARSTKTMMMMLISTSETAATIPTPKTTSRTTTASRDHHTTIAQTQRKKGK